MVLLSFDIATNILDYSLNSENCLGPTRVTPYGDRLAAGIVFYDGDSILPFGEKLFANPIR